MCSLQGYNQVSTASILISLQALVEIGSSIAVVTAKLGNHESYLRNMGLCTILAASLSACAGDGRSLRHFVHWYKDAMRHLISNTAVSDALKQALS